MQDHGPGAPCHACAHVRVLLRLISPAPPPCPALLPVQHKPNQQTVIPPRSVLQAMQASAGL